jgi:7-cyano-7-deazaguanine synthase in queuosine biosynthesis
VFLKIADVSAAMLRNVPDVLMDLLEIAVYVFGADQATGRGGPSDTRRLWRRRFQFHIPVRRPELWSRVDVTAALVEVLSFLSDDDYAFVFRELEHVPSEQLYLGHLGDQFAADEVVLFSGGLDSLGGAIEEALVGRRRVALISHDSGSKRKAQIAHLAAEVAARAAPGAVRHVPVWATKREAVGREYTQRTRSFLYAALATTVASMMGLDRIRFYENGVTSLNLPIAPQVVGGRATRTTHPQVIEGFAQLFATILGKRFAVENPFLWHTKTDVVRLIKEQGGGPFIAKAVSCSKTVEATKLHTHCGKCSQCIDRRLATLAAGLTDDEDPAEMYKVDLLTGERPFGETRAMAESFLRRASRLRDISDLDFFTEYPEVTRALRHVGLSSDTAGQQLVALHRRHAEDMFAALAEGHRRHAAALQNGRLPDSCLIVLAIPGRYRQAPKEGEPEVPTFRREGEFWRIWFERERTHLKDEVGLRHLARLLAIPGQQRHAIQLLAEEAGHSAPPRPASAGEASDQLSLRQYKARLSEIEDELAEALGASDVQRQVELREEREQISRHLDRVTDLRGRARPAADDNERARQAVSAAVRRAIGKITAKHPPLGRHLRKYLKTGLFCGYDPEPSVIWIIR